MRTSAGANNNSNNKDNNGTSNGCNQCGPGIESGCTLVQSEVGITTANGVVGGWEARPHVNPQRFMRGTEEEYRGKRHIDPHHLSLSDGAKLAEGRYGKRQVQGAPGDCKDSVSTVIGGKQNATVPQRHRVNPPNDKTATSVQMAEARALKLTTNPDYSEAAHNVLRHAGSPSIVREEERLERRIVVAEYAKGSHERCAELCEKQKAMDLGEPGREIQIHVPFALDESAPRCDSVPEHRAMHYRNAESKTAPKITTGRRGVVEHKGLRDNVMLSQNDYPDPPPVGVRVRPSVAVRPSAAQQRSKECLDEDMMRRSKARCHQSAKQRMPDFIFGQPQPLGAPRPTLREITEERWKAEENRAAGRRTGRAMAHQSHRPTALW